MAQLSPDSTVKTHRAGYWEARFLAPGPYQVSFEHEEFKQLTIEGVSVTTSEMATLDITLELGEIAFAVTVTSDASFFRNTDQLRRAESARRTAY